MLYFWLSSPFSGAVSSEPGRFLILLTFGSCFAFCLPGIVFRSFHWIPRLEGSVGAPFQSGLLLSKFYYTFVFPQAAFSPGARDLSGLFSRCPDFSWLLLRWRCSFPPGPKVLQVFFPLRPLTLADLPSPSSNLDRHMIIPPLTPTLKEN